MTTIALPRSDWWKAFYEDTPFELYLVRKNEGELNATIQFLRKYLELEAGDTLFDQCCGIGSLSLPLAHGGFKVIGVDLCEKYINRAKQNASEQELDCRFVAADAFEFLPPARCDGAFNWWTSFGYSRDDRRNAQMLKRAYDSLKPGGKFALDYPNMTAVFRNYREITEHPFETEAGQIKLVRKTKMNMEQGFREQLWTFIMPDGTSMAFDTHLRVYLPHAIADMLQECGFVDVQMYGSVHGEPLDLDNERCIFLARRPQ